MLLPDRESYAQTQYISVCIHMDHVVRASTCLLVSRKARNACDQIVLVLRKLSSACLEDPSSIVYATLHVYIKG